MGYLRFDKQVAKLQILPFFLNYVEVYHPKGSPPSLTNGGNDFKIEPPLDIINRASYGTSICVFQPSIFWCYVSFMEGKKIHIHIAPAT